MRASTSRLRERWASLMDEGRTPCILCRGVSGRIYVSVEDSDAVVEISDSPDIPLQAGLDTHQAAAVRQATLLLQQATAITVILMIVTIVGATLAARSRRLRALESPQNLPGGASSHSEQRIPPA